MLNILQILRRLGCRVSFLPENRAHAGEYTRALQAAGIEAIYHPFVSSLGQYLKETGGRYDVVIMSRVDVARQVVDAVRRYCPRARRIFDTVDLHFLREARRAEVTSLDDGSKARRMMREELAVARACEVTLVVSSAEQELLAREAPDVSVDVLSLIEGPKPTETVFSERRGILFIGSFQHPPNVDAVDHYLRRIHPDVQERLPDVPLIVIGADPPRSLISVAGDGVRFVGHVQDIGAYFSAARISVAPLRFGAGVKGKIVSSLAFGVPVVTTTVGAEGMHLEHREHTMIADRPKAFADAVVELYANEALWQRIAENGLRLMTSQFSSEEAEATITRVLGLRER
jgi:glycosyltransferase involved in cell wall biosynthesis